MAAWLAANLGTIVVALIVIFMIAVVIRSMIKDKKSGKGSCGCGCANCAMHGSCHSAHK